MSRLETIGDLQTTIFEAMKEMSGSIFKSWDYSKEEASAGQYPEHLGGDLADFAALIEAVEPLSLASGTLTKIRAELESDIKNLRRSDDPLEFLNNLREVLQINALQEVPVVLQSLARTSVDLALSFRVAFWRLPNQQRSEYRKALLEYFFNEGGYKTVSGKSVRAPGFFRTLDEKQASSTDDSDEPKAIKAMLRDVEKQIGAARELITAERFIRDTSRVCVEVTGNQQYDLKARYETLKNTRDSKFVGWFDAFGNLAEALVLSAAETILSGAGNLQLNEKIVSALATFCSVSARKAMEHAYLESIEIPLTVPGTLGVSDAEPAGPGKPIPEIMIQPKMSYLDDGRVVLAKGSIDDIGAKTYNKTANVPGSYVVDLQNDLTTLGFCPGSADGFFGSHTEQALRTFQEAALGSSRLVNGLEVTVAPTYTGQAQGECDEATRIELVIWLRNGYSASQLLPPVWSHLAEPLEQNGIPFAKPDSGLFWPVCTSHPRGREVAYKGVNGVTYGMNGRRFLADRSPDRFHVGVDLWGNDGDLIVACEDGKIVNHYHFYRGVHALFVQCDSGHVINYGEVREASWNEFGLDIGSRVQAGQPIAVVGRMKQDSMCHFEMYTEGTKENCRYYMGTTPPAALRNPTRYLLHLAAKPAPQAIRPVLTVVLTPLDSLTEPSPGEAAAAPPQTLTRIDGMNFTELDRFHSAFPGGVQWRLTRRGIDLEETGIERTPGIPSTVTRIWDEFGDFINTWAAFYQIPCVLIVATIATESEGKPGAIRKEPGYVSDAETPGRVSPGLMQTLISTARESLKKPGIDRDWLLDPNNSIQAGASYIAGQRKQTGYDPPKVACAYNAGSVRENAEPGNRWKMRQFPLGTGEHCDRFVKWFNDAVHVVSEHPKKPSVPYDVYFV